jgi:Response regulator of citrate/malate metabolism
MIRTVVIDDDERVARIHAEFVNRTPGFLVVGVARSAREAREKVREASPDLVLLDIHLPDENGLDLLRQWRSDRVTVGAIVITAAREVDAVRAALAGGAAHYIIKPFEYPDLADAMQNFRQQQDAVRAMASASQGDVDKIFGHRVAHDGRASILPKGLSSETAELVRGALGSADELSAAECADRTGISRVSVRRYLEHFVQTGVASVRLQYGRSGRPTRYYRRHS